MKEGQQSRLTVLVSLVQNGHASALDHLFNELQPIIFKKARSMRALKEQANDIVQDVFLIILKNIQSIKPSRAIAYTLRVTRNRVINDIRHQKVRSRHRQRVEQEAIRFSINGNPILGSVSQASALQRLIAKEQEVKMQAAINRLGSLDRDVLRARFFLGMEHGEIGQRLGIPIGTSYSRLNRAKQRLAFQLAVQGL